MPDGTINIYLDSTFTSVDDGCTEISNELEFVAPDNIGNYDLPVVYKTESEITISISKDLEFFAKTTSISGVDNVPLLFFRELSTDSGTVLSLADYVVGNVLSEQLNNYVLFSTGYNTVSGSFNEEVSYIGGENFVLFKNYLVEISNFPVISGSKSYWNTYINYSGNVSPGGEPIPYLTANGISIVEYEYGAAIADQALAEVDITFAGWVNFPILSDIYSVDSDITDAYYLDVLTINGGLLPHYLDIYSAVSTTSGIECDVYCSLLDMMPISLDVELIKGRIGYINCAVYSTAVGMPSMSCDVGLFPLKITNFSLDAGEYTAASEYISVDVLDDIYGVVISGTYFEVDGEQLPVTFSGIDDGYRMFYNPINDFDTLDGPTTFTVHAENGNMDELEELFYLTFGYIVEYYNRPRIDAGFDYNTKVTVRVTAENYASCPKITSDGHRLIVEHRKNADLGASIVGMFHADDVSNLSAEIYPKSTAYFYGEIFTVIINAKDFANNIIDPIILRYKIEDKPV